MLVLLPYKAPHGSIDLVDIERNGRPDVAWVVGLVRVGVSELPHVVDLIVGPAVHTQGLDLGHVRPQLPVQRGAAHAQEDAQAPARPAGVPCLTVRTSVIAGHVLDELLQSLLVARLVPLREGGHGAGSWGMDCSMRASIVSGLLLRFKARSDAGEHDRGGTMRAVEGDAV